jgi:hypothetical protein
MPSNPAPTKDRVIGSGTGDNGDSLPDQVDEITCPGPASHARMFPIVSVQLLVPTHPNVFRLPLNWVVKTPS